MATKRDRKTAFPFIKPKGSIKKDIQQYRNAVMNQNGDEDKKDIIISNPVQRRESSATRFLKHFRPDRNNPAYHSEGKGLRKRRQPWTSERELPQLEDRSVKTTNIKDRSHSFNEQDAVIQFRPSGNDKENSSGGRESIRWRFRSRDSQPKQTAKKGLIRAHSEGLPSGDNADNCLGKDTEWNGKKTSTSPIPIDSCKNAISLKNDSNQSEKRMTCSAKDLTVNNSEETMFGISKMMPSSDMKKLVEVEADYVNFEVFASMNCQLRLSEKEPDLLQNLPNGYQNKQILLSNNDVLLKDKGRCRSFNHLAPTTAAVAATTTAQNGSNLNIVAFNDPSHSSIQHSYTSSGTKFEDRRSGRDLPTVNCGAKSTPSLIWDVAKNADRCCPSSNPKHQPGPNSITANNTVPLFNATHSASNIDVSKMSTWEWNGSQDEETSYASQLRSSMAAIFNNHMRQASTNSNSSAFSSYSEELNSSYKDTPVAVSTTRPRYGSDTSQNSNGSGYETFHQDLNLYYKQYGGWSVDPDSIGLPPIGPSSSPPPPPPVRDASSLKYIKYGPGHEKHPSWPMPTTNHGQSQRSKSWTEATDYPKETSASYARPYSKRPVPVYSQQLKTVMENCERISAETFQPKALEGYPNTPQYLPSLDCDAHNVEDKNYNVPSPPERDIGVPRLTLLTGLSGLNAGSDYARYEDIQQYSHSEGYSSYVPSESSYVSVSGTPFLDQLRREGDTLVKEKEVKETMVHNGRESVTTVATNSSSNSSNETLRWHGSYSDISVMSGSSSRVDASALVVHSAKVQAPQRHNSESVLYYSTDNPKQNRAWSHRVERNNHRNSQATVTQRPPKEEVKEEEPQSPSIDTSQPPSVAERIHQLERQSRSVPNLTRGLEKNQLHRSRPNLTLANGGQSINVDNAADKEDIPKYTYLDPDKRLRVADPTLKAIQKQALLSYYERYAAKSNPLHTSAQSAIGSAAYRNAASEFESAAGHHPSKSDAQVDVHLYTSELSSNAAFVAATASAVGNESSIPVKKFHELPNVSKSSNFGLIPPERPPKKPHLRAAPPHGKHDSISPDQELRKIEASAHELMNLNRPAGQTPTKRKPPAPDPPLSPPLGANPVQNQPTKSSVPTSPSLPSTSPNSLFQTSPTASVSSQLLACSEEIRSVSPDLLPPPPPPPPCSVEVNVADDPLPPPPSPIIQEYAENGTLSTSTSLSPKTTYHKESYMVHRKNLGTHYRRSSDNIPTSESAISPSSWEKHYNVRKGSTTPTVIFSSEEMSRKEALEVNETCSEPPKSYISEITFQTGLNVSLSPSGQVEGKTAVASVDTPQHSYRSLTPTNSERFTYLRKISEGNWTDIQPIPGSKPNLYKLSDPGPRSLMELNTSQCLHHRSHSDSERYKVERTQPVISARIVDDNGDSIARNQSVGKIIGPVEGKSVAVESKPLPKVATLPRPKRPEEVECDQLTKDFINHLSPSDKLRMLFSAPDPSQSTARYVEGLFEIPLPDASSNPVSATWNTTDSPPSKSSSTSTSHVPSNTTSPSATSPGKLNSCAPLPATSVYFTTSEPKAKLLTQYVHDIKSETTSEPINSELLVKKKEELVARLARKLDVLRSEREAIQEEMEANEALGQAVTSKVSSLATPPETNKVILHVAEVDKITALLLALAGRLARAQNALLCLPSDAEAQEKMVLEGKRDKLIEQLEEAKRLKENIDRRSRQVSNLLSKYLSEDEFTDYTHFVTMKAKLVMDQREIDDKIKLGEEQLAALKETLHFRPKI